MPQTPRSRGVERHLLQALVIAQPHFLLLRRGQPGLLPAVVDDEFRSADVPFAVQQYAPRRTSIAAGSARLLVVALEILRHVIMHHQSHIGFVNAHSERICGDYHVTAVVGEILLGAAALVVGHSGVVAPDVNAVEPQEVRHRLHVFPGGAVHYRAASLHFADYSQEHRVFVTLLGGAYLEI